MMEKALLNIDKRATFYQIFGSTITSKLRIPPWFLKHISEQSPDKATLKCLSGGTWNVKLRCDEDSLLMRKGWKKFQKHNQLEEGELLVFRYDGALKFTVRIFGTNGLEREVKTPTMDKNKKASIYDGGRKRKRPEKYPYSSKFPKQTHVNGENGTEYETPRKRDAVEKAEDLLTPNIPQFVKCLKGYNVNKSCFLYVPKSFYEQLSKSDNKTTVVLRNSEGKEWRVNCVSQKGYCAFCGGWKQFASDNKLKQGHVCVFQLVNENELKVSFFHNPSESLLKEEEKKRETIMCKKNKPRSKGRCVEEKEEDDDDEEEYEEEEEEEEDETEEEEEDETQRVPCSKRIHVEEEDDDEEEGYEEETEEEEEEEEETARAGVFKKKSPRVKVRSG
ncbi:B3 domain-containing transcription factor VRN1-like isoform X2 [Lycium barbarum]|uniref:B3 domain-containing transcription factor VRN1-like isoform X2 n=1 Tax=Lycium barbarum TaxID=112863 RepID=UPI00293EB46C|nr:B3 domain-containing transcription factor VRN1-like isoform X2 [Lycium barbarum]